MTSDSNPFGTGTPGYGSANITFGDAAANGQAPAAGGALIKDTTTADFGKDVIEESRSQPVLVDFWAPWCGPCRQLAPALEKAVNARGGAVKLVKLNIDDHPAIPGQMGIQSIPAVIAFKDGQPVDGFMGALPESQIVQFLDKLGATSPQADAVEQAMEMAKQQLEAGAAEDAAQIYAQVMSMEPDNYLAIAGLAGILADNGGLDQAKELIARVGDDKQNAPEVAAVKAKIELAEQVASLGNAQELEARLAADPKDHQARYDLAMIENARGNREAAADHLLAIFKANRDWNDDAARQRLLQFFEAWGPTDEVTLSARRKLSSLMFS